MGVTTSRDIGFWLGAFNGGNEKTAADATGRSVITAGLPSGPSVKSALWRSGLLLRLVLIVAAGIAILGGAIWAAIEGFDSLDQQLSNFSSQTLPASAAAYEMEINMLGGGMGVLKHLLRADPAHSERFNEDRREFRHFLERFGALAKDPAAITAAQQASKLYNEFEGVAERLITERDAERTNFEQLVLAVRGLDERINGMHVVNDALNATQVQLRSDLNEMLLQMATYLELGTPESFRVLNDEVAEVMTLLSGTQSGESGALIPEEITKIEQALAQIDKLLTGHRIIEEDLVRFIELRRQMDNLLDEGIQIITEQNLAAANTAARAHVTNSLYWMWTFAALAAAMGMIAIWVVVQGVVRPIRALMAAADAYAQGDLSYRVAPGAIGELAALSSAMNHMAEELYESRARAAEVNSALETLVTQRTQALANVNHDLTAALSIAETASRAKSVFLANMSHELRTPLNAVIGFAQIMRDEMFGALGAAQYKTYTQDICDSGTHLLSMINNLFDLAQIDAGTFSIRAENVDLMGIIQECRGAFAEKTAQRGLELQITVAPDMPMLRADGARLKQVIQNLVDNAVKFTEPGGWVRLEAGQTADGGIRIRVSDSDVGMPLEEIASALEAFSQTQAHVSRAGGGAGLGLPLSKALTEYMGGALQLTSAPKMGTTVSLSFPVECVIRADS